MRVDTGGGGFFDAPTFQYSDFTSGVDNNEWDYNAFGVTGDSGPVRNARYGQSYFEMTPEAIARHGLPSNLNRAWTGEGTSPQWTNPNYMLTGSSLDDIGLMVKSAQHEGSTIGYRREGDQYVPYMQGRQQWDTNASTDNRGMLIVAGAAAAGAGAAAYGAGGAAGGAGEGAGSFWGSGMGDLGAAGTGATSAPGAASAGGGLSVSDLASQAGQSVQDYVSNPQNWSQIAKLGGMLAGGLAGGQGGSGQGGAQAAIPAPVPTMWGGNAGGLSRQQGPTGPMGPTETERRVRQDYLPGLLGTQGQNDYSQVAMPQQRAYTPPADAMARMQIGNPASYPKMQGLLGSDQGMAPGAQQQTPDQLNADGIYGPGMLRGTPPRRSPFSYAG